MLDRLVRLFYTAEMATRGEPPDPSDALADEQRYLDRAHLLIEQMTARARSAADDAAARAAGDWDATVAHLHLSARVASMSASGGPLCFGRIDEERGPTWHIGRRHVEDDGGEPVVVDWRAPVAVPFYRATSRDALGLQRRRRFVLDGRRLADVLDEDFDDPAGAARSSASGLPDPLLAELGRARTGAMTDIAATIAAEQDRIIRSPLGTLVLVQGGPGTGKTAVGLHRAAFLLYEHRERLEREGVLVLGPNRLFLRYISEVLPSLGETAVTQTTLEGLVPAARVRAAEAQALAELKGRPCWPALLERAAANAIALPKQPLSGATRFGSVTLGHDELGELLAAALASGGPIGLRRARFRTAIVHTVREVLGGRRGELLDAEAVATDLSADRNVQRFLARCWPSLSAAALVRQLYGRPALLAAAAQGVLEPSEQAAIRRSPSRALGEEAWTSADLPLLDETQALLAGPPRRYGHIVLDEAQDLSPMALRMVARRSLDGRSITVLGDLAQASAPAAVTDWERALDALGRPAGARIESLSVGYRVPAEIMDVANRYLAARAPGLPRTSSVRAGANPPLAIPVPPGGELGATLAGELQALTTRFQSLAVIAVPQTTDALASALRASGLAAGRGSAALAPGHVVVLDAPEAKGLEFDAVVVVEPASIEELPGGAGLLYIALTRAVQHLGIVHARPLPAPLLAA